MGSERSRIIKQIDKDEIVIDFFAGVGPFSIPIAVKARKTYAIDINPNAIEFLKLNASINKLDMGKLKYFCDDAANAPKLVKCRVNRVIMNYPEDALSYLSVALKVLNDKGFIHLYTFQRGENIDESVRKLENIVESIARKQGYKATIIWKKANREVAPRKYLVILDIFVKKF